LRHKGIPARIRNGEKDYDSLTDVEILELDNLASLMSKSPSVSEIIDFYNTSKTLKIQSIEEDEYSFIYLLKNRR